MYNLAPKYKKIEILLNKNKIEDVLNIPSFDEKKDEINKIKKINDPLFTNREKLIFEDSALVITGGFILITKDYDEDMSTMGRIFDLKDVFSYRAYKI
jgi:hypothetical protein